MGGVDVGVVGPTPHDGVFELYQGLGTYLRSGAGVDERLREVRVLATAREFNNAFEWASTPPAGSA
jgi:hypothetical protein